MASGKYSLKVKLFSRALGLVPIPHCEKYDDQCIALGKRKVGLPFRHFLMPNTMVEM